MTKLLFGIPGDLDTPTGGYRYDKAVIEGLRTLGWSVQVAELGDGFPYPSEECRRALTDLSPRLSSTVPFLVDGLALGTLPAEAKHWSKQTPLIALVHHPLASETGISDAAAAGFRRSEKEALRHVAAVIVTGKNTKEELVHNYGVAADIITIIEPGSHTERVLSYRGGMVRIVAIGSVIERKRYGVMLDALHALDDKDWHLNIIGETGFDLEELSKIEDKISFLGLDQKVSLLGALSEEEKDKVLLESHLFVQSSAYEGYGMALAEAVTAGLLPVTTNVGAASSLVMQDFGYLVAPDSSALFADGLKQAMSRLRSGDWTPPPPSPRSWQQVAFEFDKCIKDVS